MSYLTQMLGARGAELRLGGDRHGGAGRADPRLRAARRRATSATSGSISRARTLYILLPLSLVLALVLVSQGVVQNFSAYKTVPLVQATSYEPGEGRGRQPVLDAGQPRPRRRRDRADAPMGPARRRSRSSSSAPTAAASSTSTRRIPFENPTPLSNFLEMLAILLISGGALLHLRQDGRRHPAGLGGPRGDDRHLRRRCSACATGRSSAATRGMPRSASTQRRAPSSRAATWRARRSASASPTPRSGRPPPPPPPTARSTRCTTRSRRSAGWCRCS